MITLNSTGEIARFYDRIQINRPRNLCSLFWATLFLAFLFIGIGDAILFAILGAVLWLAGMPHWTLGFTFLGIGIGLVGGVVGTIIWWDERPKRTPAQWRQNLTEAYQGFKNKYCPLISYQ